MSEDLTVEIGYDVRLAAALGGSAALVAVLLWIRAVSDGSLLDGAVATVVSLLALGSAAVAVGARAPLLVADDRGVRVKLGGEWCGFPWVSIRDYEVRPRRSAWADGQLLLHLQHTSHQTESLSAGGRRRVATHQRRRRADVALPLGLITGVSRGDEQQLAGRLGVLAARGGEDSP